MQQNRNKPVSLGRYRRNCSVCSHSKRTETEADFVSWENALASQRLSATNSEPKPGDFPLGSLESRAAACAILGTLTGEDCICFPPDEPPYLELKGDRGG